MALTKLTTDLIDGSLGTDWQATPKTADFTAVAGEGYFVNTTSAAITVTLPSSPSSGDEVNLVDYAGTADTNNITITSSNNINGAADDVVINYERGGVSMVYVDATQGWIAYNAANETATALNPLPPLEVDYLVVAGGGAGGAGLPGAGNGGGGGAGGLRTSYGSTSGGGASAETSLSLTTATNYTVTVGAGGTSTTSTSSNGNDSVFSTITSIGGGYGEFNAGSYDGADGGSGGGTTNNSSTNGSGTANQGYDGGIFISSSSNYYPASGGGGASQQGFGANGTVAGAGGAGLEVNIIGGTGNYYAGGGGGSGGPGATTGGLGGAGGGGNGGLNTSGTAGSPNTGGGGGGSQNSISRAGGAGGSGVVILRYPNTYTVTIGAGLTGTTATDGSDKVTTFTAGTGTISFS